MIYFNNYLIPFGELSVFFQCLFSTWLSEKEDAVSKIHTSGFKDQSEMLTSLQKLAVCIVLAYSSFFFNPIVYINTIFFIFLFFQILNQMSIALA